MSTTTIRVPTTSHIRLRRLAAEQDRPIGEVIAGLLDDHEKRAFFAGMGEDLERLRADPAALPDYEAEVAAWNVTLGDGLADEPPAG